MKFTFEMMAGSNHIGIFNLRENRFEFRSIFERRARTLSHDFDSDTELTDIISAGEAFLESRNKIVKGRQDIEGIIFRNESLLSCFGKERDGDVDFVRLIFDGSDVAFDLEDSASHCGERCILVSEEGRFTFLEGCHSRRRRGSSEN